MKGYIYKITNIIDNTCYIGQSSNKKYNTTGEYSRALSHFKHKILTRPNWHDDITRNPQNYTCYIIELIECSDENALKEALNNREYHNVIAYNSFKKGYNKTRGGDNMHPCSFNSNEITITLVNIRIK